MIIVYNRTKDIHTGENNYKVYPGSGVLSNPYTDLKEKRKSIYYVKNPEEGLVRYSSYFDMMYRGNKEFISLIDEIYDKYKSGTDVYLEDYFTTEKGAGDIIKEKLQQRLVKEKLKNYAIKGH